MDVGEEMLSNVAEKEGCEILEPRIEGDIIRAVARKKEV